MEILITSKTRKGRAACVGGLVIAGNRYVRLLNPGNWDQYADTPFEIGHIWDISFSDRPDAEPPHVEDVIIHSKRFVRNVENITEFILQQGVEIFRGTPNSIFNRKLQWTWKGNGYIADKDNLPQNSVGFWIPDNDLTFSDTDGHYSYPAQGRQFEKKIKYVGFKPPVPTIPAGTLTRVSLARWWAPEDAEMEEKRCYLQLSGWY